MVQVPVPLNMVTVDPAREHTAALAASTDSVTVNPESEVAATGNVLLYAAVPGAAVVNVMV